MLFPLKYLVGFLAIFLVATSAQSFPSLHEKKQNPSDLEVSGALTGLPADSVRYITREELLAMPQVSFNASGDTNFSGVTRIRGVRLEDLARALSASPSSDMVVAICDDEYRAIYPQAYLKVHHPVLVLEVNGKAPAGWPKDSQEHKYDQDGEQSPGGRHFDLRRQDRNFGPAIPLQRNGCFDSDRRPGK